MLGSAGVIVMDDSTDMVVRRSGALARFYAHESLRPVHAVPRRHRVDDQDPGADPGRGRASRRTSQLLLDLSENMTGKTICVLSDSCAAPVVSGIQKFRGEFEAYIAGAREPALAGV